MIDLGMGWSVAKIRFFSCYYIVLFGLEFGVKRLCDREDTLIAFVCFNLGLFQVSY